MEKEKNIISLDARIARVRELAKKSQCCTFEYRFMTSPYQKFGCRYFELSHEEAEGLTSQFSKIFKKDVEVSRFNVECISGDQFLKLGINSGEGYVNGQDCRFNFLMVQNKEFASLRMCCKDKEGEGLDHELYPVFTVSCLPVESQELLSSVLDIVEERLV